MSKTSSANQTAVLLVIGKITSNQYRLARLSLIYRGFKPKVVRLKDPNLLYQEFHQRLVDLQERLGVDPHRNDDEEAAYWVLTNILKIQEASLVKAIVLKDDDDRNANLQEGLEHCDIRVERWLVGLDGSPAYNIG